MITYYYCFLTGSIFLSTCCCNTANLSVEGLMKEHLILSQVKYMYLKTVLAVLHYIIISAVLQSINQDVFKQSGYVLNRITPDVGALAFQVLDHHTTQV